MMAAFVGAVVIALCGGGFVWAGREMVAGKLSPKMGHQTKDNTTPSSWQAMQTKVGRSIESCGKTWIVAAAATMLFAPVGVALLTVSSGVLVVQIAGASTLLEPSG